MAIMSPICSTAGAIATGIMNRIAAQWKLGAVKAGSASQPASRTGVKSTRPMTSASR